MFADQLPIPILVTAVQVAEMIAMPIESNRVEKLCPYLWSRGGKLVGLLS
jgi:hypothetical protein